MPAFQRSLALPLTTRISSINRSRSEPTAVGSARRPTCVQARPACEEGKVLPDALMHRQDDEVDKQPTHRNPAQRHCRCPDVFLFGAAENVPPRKRRGPTRRCPLSLRDRTTSVCARPGETSVEKKRRDGASHQQDCGGTHAHTQDKSSSKKKTFKKGGKNGQ